MEPSAEATETLRRRVRQQEVVAELGQQALATADLDRLMQDAAAAVADTLDCDYCKVLELLPGGDEVFLRQGVGWREGLVGDATVPTEMDSQAGYTLRTEAPVIVDDLRTEDRFSGPDLLLDHDVVSGISVVIGSVEEPWGVLGTHTTERREFTEDDATFVRSVANVLAAAIDRASKERRLRERERRLDRYKAYTDDVLDAVDDVFCIVDEAGRVQRWNDTLRDVTGHPDAEIGSLGLPDFVHPDDEAAVEAALEEGFENGSVRVEARLATGDGAYVPYELAASTLPDLEGEPVLACIWRDVSARKERSRELDTYERIIETINDGIYVVDPGGHYTMVNEAFADLTGYAREELLGAHATLVVDESTLERAGELRAEMAGDASANPTLESSILTADGERVPVEVTFASLPSDDGKLRVGVVRDVSEREAQRRKLEESERRYRTLAEHFPDGAVGLYDEELRYTAVGGELLEAAGVDEADRVGSSVYDIYPDELVDEIEPYFRAALEGEANSFEKEYHDRQLFAHTLPVEDEDGSVIAGMLVVQDVTERLEVERELRESEAKFRMLAENLEEIVWMATADAEEFIYINPAFESVWGIDRERLYEDPMAFLEVVHPDDRESVREGFAVLPEREFDEEFRIVRPDGEVRWVRARGAQVRDDDGGMVRTVGIGEDVTGRKRRERQLAESERRYRTLAEHFPNGAVGVYDHDLRYTLAEGMTLGDRLPAADELEGTRMPELFPEDTVADLEPLFRAAVEDGETGSVTTRFAGRDWRVWATPLRGGDGDVFAGLSFAQDITEQVEREAELERALDLLDKTERIADVGGWEIDAGTMDVFWTDHIFDLLELDEEEEEPPLGEALDMYDDEDAEVVEGAVEGALETGDSFDVEVRIRTGSGEIRWLRLQGVPETDDGEVVAVRGAAQDVTDRVRRERRLEELVGRLEESNERLEQFAYAASHDLQEPLRMVSSYLRLIERRYGEELDADGREFIDFAVDGADRMRDMIDGLLEYSRVETHGEAFEPVDLDAVLDDVRDDLQVKLDETDADLAAGSLPRVEGDASQLRQLFQNLLSNAIEYSGDEPPRIRVSAERTGGTWTVSVADEGIGIDALDQERIFEVFQRVHGSEEYSGTGIGLALCERIVERHGGEIRVESEPGEGATFSFELPPTNDE